MSFASRALLIGLLLAGVAPPTVAAEAQGPVRLAVEPLVTLPADVRHPEGLTANPANGDLYVGTFDAREPASARNNRVLRYAADGRLLASYAFGPTPLTGLAFADGRVYVLNFGASALQRLPADFSADSPLETVVRFGPLAPPAVAPREVANPDGSVDRIVFGAAGFPAINGMVFGPDGTLYVSDSFQGAILAIDNAARCAPCAVRTVSRDPLLATAAHLPFGANGLAFGTRPGLLYVLNAGDGRLMALDLATGALRIVSESLPGADGLLFHAGLLWVAANQADTVFGVDERGLIRVRAGEFLGIAADGTPRGLLFPASTAVSGEWMVVTNLALPLTPVEGDEWEERVTRWNLVRFRLPRDLSGAPLPR